MNILYWTAEEIRRACGNADYKLVLMQNHEDNINIRNGEVEKMLHASATSLAMNLLIDGRDGFFRRADGNRFHNCGEFLRNGGIQAVPADRPRLVQ